MTSRPSNRPPAPGPSPRPPNDPLDPDDARATRVDHEIENRARGMRDRAADRNERGAPNRRSTRQRACRPSASIHRVSKYANRYELMGLLGVGGMGSVYRVRDLLLQDEAALKILQKDQGQSQLAVGRFHREVKLARRIIHRNVVRVFDAGHWEGEHYYTMECIVGDVMSALMSPGGLPLPRCLDLGLQLASGISGAHLAGVVHRDLKPENVMVARDGRVVITDFGVAIARDEPGVALLPMHGAGTPLYMAPEQMEGRGLDERTDLYSIGLLLYELLAGRLPWGTGDEAGGPMARLAVPAPDVRQWVPSVPDAVANVLSSLLDREPSGRPQSATAVVEVLQRCLEQVRSEATCSAPRHEAPEPQTARAPERAIATTGTPHLRAVAVLPVRNLGDESDEYLAKALTEELIDRMVMCPGLRVASRLTMRQEDGGDLVAVGRRAGVDAVIECSMQKRANGSLRVRAHVVEMERGFVLWTDKFECRAAEVLELQETIANALARTITMEMGKHHGAAAPENRQNVELFLRARKAYGCWTRAGVQQSLDLLSEALSVSPEDPLLRIHKALAQLRLWCVDPRAPESVPIQALAAARAVLSELPNLGEAHLAHGIHGLLQADWSAAARHMEEAVRCNPALSDAHCYLGTLRCWTGHTEQGMRMLDVAVRLDPWNLAPLWQMALTLALLGRPKKAYECLERADYVSENHPSTVATRLQIAAWNSDHKELMRAQRDAAQGSVERSSLDSALIRLHTDADPVHQIGVLTALASSPHAPAMMRGRLLLAVAERMLRSGDYLEALSAIRAGARWTVDKLWLERCSILAPLHRTPPFQAVLAQVSSQAARIFPSPAPGYGDGPLGSSNSMRAPAARGD